MDSTPLLHNHDIESDIAPLARLKASECTLQDACFLAEGAQRATAEQRTVQRKLLAACILCFIFMVAEVIGGYLAGSLAIMSDAAHMLSDVAGFAVSLFAAWVVTQRSHESYSFGYHRLEIIGALISVLVIWGVTGALVVEGVRRVIEPQPVDGKLMFIIATAGIVFNIVVGLVLGHHHHHGPGGGSCGHSHGHDHGHSHSHDRDHGHSHTQDHSHGQRAGNHSHGHSCNHGHNHSHGLNHHHDHNHDNEDDHNHGHTQHSHSHNQHTPQHPGGSHSHGHEGAAHGGSPGALQQLGSEVVQTSTEHQHDDNHCCGHEHDHHEEATPLLSNAEHQPQHPPHHDHTHSDAQTWPQDSQHTPQPNSSPSLQKGTQIARRTSSDSAHKVVWSNGGDPADSLVIDMEDGAPKPDSLQDSHAEQGSSVKDQHETSSGCCHHAHDHGEGDHHHDHGHGHHHGPNHNDRGGNRAAAAGGIAAQQHGQSTIAAYQRPSMSSCDGHSHGHEHGHAHDHENINLRSAVLHVIGDLVQSIGVAIAGLLIWWHQDDPRWQIADPICTFLFAVLVLLTTVTIMRDILHTLMERTPSHLDAGEISEAMEKVDGVLDVHDLHVWNLSMGMPILTAHVHIGEQANVNTVLQKLERYARRLGIRHSTIQVCNPERAASGQLV